MSDAMQLLFGHDATVWQWANRYFESPLPQPTFAVGLIDDGGVLRGAALGTERSEATVSLTICGDRAITPKVAREFFRLVFARYWRLEIRTTKGNKTAKRNAPKFGFKFEGTARDYWGPGKSSLMFSMLADECRWLKRRTDHGRLTTAAGTVQRERNREKAG